MTSIELNHTPQVPPSKSHEGAEDACIAMLLFAFPAREQCLEVVCIAEEKDVTRSVCVCVLWSRGTCAKLCVCAPQREPLTRARSEEMGRSVPGLPDGWMKVQLTFTLHLHYI